MKKLHILLILFLMCIDVNAQDWQFLEDITPSESAESDFGANMVFAGDKLVVAWPRIFTRGNNADSCGEVITYNKVAGLFQEIARLTAQDLTGSCANGDGFGYGLAYDNGKLAIGMPAGVRAGMGATGGAADVDSRVFITKFEDDNWVLAETLIASDLANGKGMGFQLVMENDLLLVHAHEYDTIFGFSFPVSTGVYVFEDSGSGYVETQKLEENFHLFGQDFDYENGQIIVGAWGEQALTQPGRIYIYEKIGSTWQSTQVINDSRNYNLGNQVEIYGNTLVAGNVQAGGIGGATVFDKNNDGTWSEVQFIQASDNEFNDQFGITIRLDEDELIVGAGAGGDSQQTLGAVYTYSKNGGGQFIEQQKLLASNSNNLYDRFAGNLIFNDSSLLVNSTSGGFENADVTTFHHFTRESSGMPNTYFVNEKNSGTWIPNGADNQKISLELLSENRAVLFASLNHENENIWLVAVGNVNENTINFTSVNSTSGAQFGNDFNSQDVVRNDQGEIMLEFQKCNEAILSYDFLDFGSGEITIIKDIEILGNECGNINKSLPNGVSGAWFDVNRSGEGFTNYIFDQGGQQMAAITWYTYDQNGNQMWISGIGAVNDQTVEISQMIKYTGGNLFSSTAETSILGSLTMRWNNCYNAVVDYDFSVANLGVGQFNLSQLTVLNNTQCNQIK